MFLNRKVYLMSFYNDNEIRVFWFVSKKTYDSNQLSEISDSLRFELNQNNYDFNNYTHGYNLPKTKDEKELNAVVQMFALKFVAQYMKKEKTIKDSEELNKWDIIVNKVNIE